MPSGTDASAGSIVGRDRERSILRSHLDDIGARGPALVVVTGEPGIGKTSLLDDLGRHAATGGFRVIRGQATERVTSGFDLWTGPRRQLSIPMAAATADPDERRWELLDELTAALDDADPTLVILDDIHWADDASLWVLDRLPAGLEGPILVVAGCRDARSAPAVRSLRSAAVLPLAGLDPAAVGELARRAKAEAPIDVGLLHARTGGNPLFVREVLGAPAGTQVPGEVGPLLDAVLDRLPVPAQRTVSALAVAGEDAPVAVLAAAVGRTVADISDDLAQAIAAEVLVRGELGSIRFRHALLADVAAGRLPADDRRVLHRDLADRWVATGAGTRATARAAAHRLAAVPLADPEAASREAMDAAGALQAAGDPVAAAALLTDAVAALTTYAPGAHRARTVVALRLGDALDAAGDQPGAAAAFTAAVAAAQDVDDPDLRAEAELGADRHLPMFTDIPARLDRLRQVEQALPPGDHPLRAGLLGRQSVALDARPGRHHDAAAVNARGLAMAQRIGDPELVARVLIDHHLVPRTPDALRGRAEAAEELGRMADRTGRGDLATVAGEWAWSGALLDGDLEAADRICARLEVGAAVSSSPVRRFAALTRRAGLDALAGRRADALAVLEELAAVGRRGLPRPEAEGIEEGIRTLLARQFGRPDPQLAELQSRAVDLVRGPAYESPFFTLHVAMTHLTLGHVDDAAAIVRRWAPVVIGAPPGTEIPSTIANLATLVADLGIREHAAGTRVALGPFAGFVSMEFGLVADLPVDTLLGRLALLDGDGDAAIRHAEVAVRLSLASGSPVYGAWTEWFLADALEAAGRTAAAADARRRARAAADAADLVLPASSSSQASATTVGSRPDGPAAVTATATRGAGEWLLDSPFGSAAVAGSLGLDQLVALLRVGPRELAATDLAGAPGAPVAADLGPMLDPAAKRAYRRRIGELEAEIEEADRFADPERSARAQLELDAVIAELRRAVGIGGRDRPNAAGAERARVNVTRSLRRAIAAVAAVAPELGAHLDVSVRTGSRCSYRPDPAAALEWTVTEAGD